MTCYWKLVFDEQYSRFYSRNNSPFKNMETVDYVGNKTDINASLKLIKKTFHNKSTDKAMEWEGKSNW